MTTVVETLGLPGGVDPKAVTWELFVAGSNGRPIIAYGPDATVIDTLKGRPTDAGLVELTDVVPTSAITPAGTRYGYRLTVAGRELSTRFLLVPDSPIAVEVRDCLSAQPGSILDPDEAAQLSDRIALLEDALGSSEQTGGDPDDVGDVITSGGTP